MTWTVTLGLAIILLLWQNYRLEKRWRALRYSWQCMADFAGARLQSEDGTHDPQWLSAITEHRSFLSRFGATVPVGAQAIKDYELELINRNYEILSEHQVY